MRRVPSASSGSSRSFPFVNAEIASSALWNIRLSWMVKQRSAITKLSVRCLSEVLPPQAFEANEMCSCVVIPAKTLAVL